MDRTRLLGLGRRLNHLFARAGADLLVPVSAYTAGGWVESAVPSRVVRNCAYPLHSSCEGPSGIVAPLRCMVAGRLHRLKGHHVAIEAVRLARERGANCELDIFGGPLSDNPYADELRSSIARHRLENVVRMKGFVSDMRAQHVNYHVGLQCRIDPEPCSVWVCEAHVDGLPLVASATGGTPELLEDGVTGLLVPPDDPGALADALTNLAAQPERLRSMRSAAFERGAQAFSPARFRSDMLDAYDSVAS